MSLIVSVPSAIATATSTRTRPGSCRGRRPRTPSNATLSSAVNVVASARSASSSRARVRRESVPVRGHDDSRASGCSLHLGSASLPDQLAPSASQVSPGRRALSSIAGPTRRPTHEEPGLESRHPVGAIRLFSSFLPCCLLIMTHVCGLLSGVRALFGLEACSRSALFSSESSLITCA